MSDLTKLVARLGRHADQGKGIRLSPDELDMLVTSGAFEALSKVAAEELRKQAIERLESRSKILPPQTGASETEVERSAARARALVRAKG